MVDKLLFVATQKLAVFFVGGLSVVGGLLTMGTTPVHTGVAGAAGAANALSQTAIVANAMASLPSSASSSTITATSTPTSTVLNSPSATSISFNLLPTTTIPFCPSSPTSTCARKNIQTLIRISALVKKAAPVPTASTIPTTTIAIIKKTVSAVVSAAATPAITAPMMTITAQSFLDDTTSSLKVLLNGSDELVFTTNLGNGQPPLTWGLLTTTVGGDGSAGSAATASATANAAVPQFSVTSSCDPAPLPAAPGALDKNPTFNVRTSYNCSVSLTPTSGSNQVTQSKTFSFTTAPGELIVTNDAAMNTLLGDNTNNGGIVFNNQDTNPVTLTGVTFDASYSYLNILNGPLVLRFLDPTTNQSLADYHLEKIPATGDGAGNGASSSSTSNTYTYAQSGITVPLSFTIPPSTQKMLPIEVLGVDRMFVLGTSPTVSITLHSVTTNEAGGGGGDGGGVKTVMASPNITWSCSVSTASYDPNATSGVYATGQACLN
jgi:hypothetical protein